MTAAEHPRREPSGKRLSADYLPVGECKHPTMLVIGVVPPIHYCTECGARMERRRVNGALRWVPSAEPSPSRPSAWREAARRVLGVLGERSALDTSGLAVPQMVLLAKLTDGQFKAAGTVTYVCHSCGHLITRPWECFFVDDTPGREWASSITPAVTTARTTTHHAAHLAAD